jgi:ATP-dependent Clp protease ATP-binding subunit ClpA
MARKLPSSPLSGTTTTWLLFRGKDSGGKAAVARELARLVFGSYGEFTALQAGNSDEPTRSGKLTLKRQRSPGDGNGDYALARLFQAITENPHRVILIDGVDRLDLDSEMRIKDVMMKGTVRGCNDDEVGLEDAIVVLCSDVLDSRYVVSSPEVKRRLEEGDATGKEVRSYRRLGLDLNACPEDGEDEEDILADAEAFLNFVDGVFSFSSSI